MTHKIEALTPFARNYTQGYPRNITYPLGTEQVVIATSTPKFVDSRGDLVHRLITGTPKLPEFTTALVTEQLLRLTLQPVLLPHGFNVEMAPQSLEC